MENTQEYEIRQKIIATYIKMNESRLNQGSSGNIGIRPGEGILITPSEIDHYEMKPGDIV